MVTLMDGGMGQELIARASRAPTPMWSAQVLIDEPALVEQVHLDFIRAGARMIIVNAYSATRWRLEKHGMLDRFEELQRLACEVASRARDIGARETGEEILIAGCLPPLEWSYRPELTRDEAQSVPEYADIARLQAPFVDVLLCETMNSGAEARYAAMGAQDSGKPVWVAWTVDDTDGTRLRSGESIAEGAAMLDDLRVDARLVNCSRPEAVTQAVPEFVKLGGPVGAYANAFRAIASEFKPGTTVELLDQRPDMGPAAYAQTALGWIDAGVSIIGGCCEISPDHIRVLAEHLRASGHLGEAA